MLTRSCSHPREPRRQSAAALAPCLPPQIDTVIQDYVKRLEERTKHHLGYPYNLDFDYGPLEALQKFSINNLGDPFIESNYGEGAVRAPVPGRQAGLPPS